MKNLTDLPEHMRTEEWIESCIKYEKHKGIHTYHECECHRGLCRSNMCVDCWKEYLFLLDKVIVKTSSHRSRDKLKSLLGYDPPRFFSFNKIGDWRQVPIDKLNDILNIKGITRSKLPEGAIEYH